MLVLSFVSGVDSFQLPPLPLMTTLAEVSATTAINGDKRHFYLASGQIHVNFGPMTPMLAFARDSRINLLATTLDRRTTVMPDLPTLREAGIEGIRGAGGLQAVMGPPKLSPDIVESLNAAIRTIMADSQMRAKFAQRGQEAENIKPEQAPR